MLFRVSKWLIFSLKPANPQYIKTCSSTLCICFFIYNGSSAHVQRMCETYTVKMTFHQQSYNTETLNQFWCGISTLYFFIPWLTLRTDVQIFASTILTSTTLFFQVSPESSNTPRLSTELEKGTFVPQPISMQEESLFTLLTYRLLPKTIAFVLPALSLSEASVAHSETALAARWSNAIPSPSLSRRIWQ